MKTSTPEIIIVGGGLSGLTLAYLLSKNNIEAKILEASDRLGGRIQTHIGKLETPLELGATWLTPQHYHLISLLDELGIQKYPQFLNGISLFQNAPGETPHQFSVPVDEQSSFRIAGGTGAIIKALADQIPGERIFLNSKVESINQQNDKVTVSISDGKVFKADQLVVCLPPQLIGTTISFDPVLPNELLQLFPQVQTWMASSIKFIVEYDQPFWRSKGYSGMLYSQRGIISEMYDHTNFEGSHFGFTGFLNPAASNYTQDDRRKLVLSQLQELFGEDAANPSLYSDKIWDDEYVMGENEIVIYPHQHNGHALLQQSYMDGKLHFAGTETSAIHPGYMEGAVLSAKRVAERLLVKA